MGKHEIRVRRKKMTSRMIDRHKDYDTLLNQHHKAQKYKKWITWLVYLFMAGLTLGLYFGLVKKKNATQTQGLDPVNKSEIELTYTAGDL